MSSRIGFGTKRGVKVAAVATFLLLVPLLSGCTGLPGGPSKLECPSIPRATYGESYVYDVEGPLRMPYGGALLLDWGLIHPEGEGVYDADYPEGSSLRINIGDGPEDRLDLYGRHREAVQASYWLTHAQYGGPVAFHDEWIDAETGQLIQTNSRYGQASNFEEEGDEKGDAQRLAFERVGFPPLYLSPFFWGEDLALGAGGKFEFPLPLFSFSLKGVGDQTDQLGWGEIQYRVTDMEKSGDVCTIDLHMWSDTEGSGFLIRPGQDMTIRFSTDHALPVKVSGTKEGDPLFTINLADAGRTEGTELPLFQQKQGFERSVLSRAPLSDGFVKDMPGLFPTSYGEALAAIRENESFREWKASHPDARPSKVIHVLAPPEPNGLTGNLNMMDRRVDTWRIYWMEPDGDMFLTWADKVRPFVNMVFDEEIEVYVNEDPSGSRQDEYPMYNETDEWVTLEELNWISKQIYDAPVEALVCNMWVPICHTVGPHKETGVPYAGQSGAFSSGGGVWLHGGWLVSFMTESDHALGPPAGE